MKRLRETLTVDRDFIITPFYWWQTFDNAVDEYWWGVYNGQSFFKFMREATQADYDSSAFIRYVCRLTWMLRNAGYGFAQYLFGRKLDEEQSVKTHGTKGSGFFWYRLTIRKSSWQLQAQVPLFGKRYNDINIGWKTHEGFDRVMYAGRVIGLRSYK